MLSWVGSDGELKTDSRSSLIYPVFTNHSTHVPLICVCVCHARPLQTSVFDFFVCSVYVQCDGSAEKGRL